MKGIYLKFYAHENTRIRHTLFYEWLLRKAKDLGIHGGTAFRATAGFGRHGVMHALRYWELAGDLAMEVEFLVSEEEADRLLEQLRSEKIRLFYVKIPALFGVLNADDLDSPEMREEAKG